MSDTAHGPFEGPDRLEVLPTTQRPIRMGHPEALAVSDARRVVDGLDAGSDEAQAYLQYLQPGYVFIVVGSFEWALRSGAHLRAESPDRARALLERVHETWSEAARMDGYGEHEAWTLLRPLLAPGSEPDLEDVLAAVGALMQGTPPAPTHPVGQLLAEPMRLFGEVASASDAKVAADAFRRWQEACRARHDLLITYTWAFSRIVEEDAGQHAAEEAIRAPFHACSFFQPMQQMAAALSPEETALMLAEHLRHHFSGPGREGSVRVVEEADRYRLLFDPCGTGGAARNRPSARRLAVLPDASPATWGRAGEVPHYCTHCAQNELAFIESLGYPKWVTEFDPDPSKPCGWTVYKNADDIPAEYFERLGHEKP